MQAHRERGEKVFIVSASLQEKVQYVAADLGFDGGIGSTCEIIDGVFTGRSLTPCYGRYKAEAIRGLAAQRNIDLARSTAYSDSHTQIAFLEAVGHPVAINPAARLRRIATVRGWRVLRFD